MSTLKSIFHERWVSVTLQSLFCLLLLGLVYFVASHREPDLVDEGYYYYEAWARIGSSFNVQLTSTSLLLTNFGNLLGLPYLLMKEPGILFFRLYSMIVWLACFGLYFYACLRKTETTLLLFFPLLGLVLFSMVLLALSYQTMPIALTVAASGLFLMATRTSRQAQHFLYGLGINIFLFLSILAYTPGIPVVGFILLSAAILLKSRGFHLGLLTGFLCGVVTLMVTTEITPWSLYAYLNSGFGNGEIDSVYGESSGLMGRALIRLKVFFVPHLKAFVTGFFLMLTVLAALYFPYWPFKNKKLLQMGSFLTLTGLTLFVVLKLFPWASQGQPFNRMLILLSFSLLPFLFVAFRKVGQTIAWQYGIALLWIVLSSLIQLMLGASWVEYYVLFSAPALLGATWIMATAANNQSSQRHKLVQLFLHVLFVVLVVMSVHTFLFRGYHQDAAAIDGTVALSGDKLIGIYASPKRAKTLKTMQAVYDQNHCEKRFFCRHGSFDPALLSV